MDKSDNALGTIKRIIKHPLSLLVIGGLLTGLVLEPYVIHPIKQRLAPPRVEITSPLDKEGVEWSPIGYLATGTYSGLKEGHKLYVLVHPMPTSKWYVQQVPTFIDSNWQAIVYFGTADVGIGDYYALSAIITSKSLKAEQVLENFPLYDAKDVITIKRKGGVFAITTYEKYLHPGTEEFVTVAWGNIDTERATRLQVTFINAWGKPLQHYPAEDLENDFKQLGEVTRGVPIPEDAKPGAGGQFRAMFVDEDGNVVTHYETAEDVVILPKITISSPEPGGLPSPQNVLISGYISGTLPEWTLWTFVQSRRDQRYYPQAEAIPTGPSAAWSVMGWTGKEPSVQEGDEFNIVIALADESATQELWLYMRQAAETGRWNGFAELPPGALVLEERTIFWP